MDNSTTVTHMIGGTLGEYFILVEYFAIGFLKINSIPIIFTIFERDSISKSTVVEKSAAGLMPLKLHSHMQRSFVEDFFCKCKKFSSNETVSKWIYQKQTTKILFCLAKGKIPLQSQNFILIVFS